MMRSLALSMFLATVALHGTAEAQSRPTGRFGLSIDGESANLGWVKDFDGLHFDVEFAMLTMELGVTPGIVRWLADSLSGELEGSDIVLVELDDEGEVVSTLALAEAEITALRFPTARDDKQDVFTLTVRGKRSTGRYVVNNRGDDEQNGHVPVVTPVFTGTMTTYSGKRQHGTFHVQSEDGTVTVVEF